jgi:hypothetical protein
MDPMEGLAILEYLDGRFLKPLERGAWDSRRGRVGYKDSKRLSEMTERAREPRAKQIMPSPNPWTKGGTPTPSVCSGGRAPQKLNDYSTMTRVDSGRVTFYCEVSVVHV